MKLNIYQICEIAWYVIIVYLFLKLACEEMENILVQVFNSSIYSIKNKIYNPIASKIRIICD